MAESLGGGLQGIWKDGRLWRSPGYEQWKIEKQREYDTRRFVIWTC